jgi:hypothetical protein
MGLGLGNTGFSVRQRSFPRLAMDMEHLLGRPHLIVSDAVLLTQVRERDRGVVHDQLANLRIFDVRLFAGERERIELGLANGDHATAR